MSAPTIPAVDGWTPVSELPDNPDWIDDAPLHVLCYSATHDWGGRRMEVFEASSFYTQDEAGVADPSSDAAVVTHWRPLPAPPAIAADELDALEAVLAVRAAGGEA